jgi:hypothetical protein
MIGKGWDREAHDLWQRGERSPAVTRLVSMLGNAGGDRPELAMQATYYLFLQGEYQAARQVVAAASARFPDHNELAMNLGVLCGRCDDHAGARAAFERYLALGGQDPNAFDGLAYSCHRLGDDESARTYGRRSIERKTTITSSAPRFPLGEAHGGKNVISFSLWGDRPRYLRGAMQNALRTRAIYPDYVCRYYLDPSVPADLVDALEAAGCEVVRDDGEPDHRRRLTRRFLVANDPDVGRFLIRDCDSVISVREAAAVAQWTQSGLPFHVMRDWWTHSDPIMAGMWGGRGGVLPQLEPMLAGYQSAMMETPNWDQWFLRDCLWPTIRHHAMVHDRLFGDERTLPFPGDAPPAPGHIGQDEYAVRRREQARELARFAKTVPSLQL